MSENTESTGAGQSSEDSRLPFTRRGALAVGSALLGMGLTGESAAGAAPNGGRRVPASSPWKDDDSNGLLETDRGFSGIDTNVVRSDPVQTEPDIGIVPREIISQRDTTIHVDPAGDDENDGSEDNPVATIQEAVNRLPLFILHDITIDIADGEYTSEKESPAVHVGPVLLKGEGDINLFNDMLQNATAANTTADNSEGHTFSDTVKSAFLEGGKGNVTVAGNESDPSKVYVDVGINWTAFGKLEHMRIKGIHWDFLSQFAGHANVRNCIFRGNGAAAVSGKNGHVFFKNCDIGDSDRDQYAIWGIQLERMYFDYCTLNATEAALNVFNGDIYQLSGRNEVNAPETFTMSGGALATQGTDLYVGGEKK